MKRILGLLKTRCLLCSISQLELSLQQYKRRHAITVDKPFTIKETVDFGEKTVIIVESRIHSFSVQAKRMARESET